MPPPRPRQDGIEGVGEALQNAAQQAILRGEILMLERQIVETRQDFGPEVYDAMEMLREDGRPGSREMDQLFDQYRNRIDRMYDELEEKEYDLEVLNNQYEI